MPPEETVTIPTVGYTVDTEGYTVLTVEVHSAAVNTVDITDHRLPTDFASSIKLIVSEDQRIYAQVKLLSLPHGFENHPLLRIAIYDKFTTEYSEWFSVMTDNLPPITVNGLAYNVFALGGKLLTEVEQTWPEFINHLPV